jgi:hypothetical protein
MHSAARTAGSSLQRTARRLVLALALGALACSTGRASRGDDEPVKTTIDVQNQGFNDMTVYALREGVRTRLGIAPGNTTTVLTIPPALLSGTTFLRFVADPIGGNRTPVTEEVDVSPGDQLVMIINPGG